MSWQGRVSVVCICRADVESYRCLLWRLEAGGAPYQISSLLGGKPASCLCVSDPSQRSCHHERVSLARSQSILQVPAFPPISIPILEPKSTSEGYYMLFNACSSFPYWFKALHTLQVSLASWRAFAGRVFMISILLFRACLSHADTAAIEKPSMLVRSHCMSLMVLTFSISNTVHYFHGSRISWL